MEKISSAPLRPQQKIYLLTAFVQPKNYHQGTYANLCIKDVRKMDMLIRYIVKKWTRLPKNLATAIIHAYVRDGCSGVKSMVNLTNGIPRQFKKSTARLHEARQKHQDNTETAPGVRVRQ